MTPPPSFFAGKKMCGNWSHLIRKLNHEIMHCKHFFFPKKPSSPSFNPPPPQKKNPPSIICEKKNYSPFFAKYPFKNTFSPKVQREEGRWRLGYGKWVRVAFTQNWTNNAVNLTRSETYQLFCLGENVCAGVTVKSIYHMYHFTQVWVNSQLL